MDVSSRMTQVKNKIPTRIEVGILLNGGTLIKYQELHAQWYPSPQNGFIAGRGKVIVKRKQGHTFINWLCDSLHAPPIVVPFTIICRGLCRRRMSSCLDSFSLSTCLLLSFLSFRYKYCRSVSSGWAPYSKSLQFYQLQFFNGNIFDEGCLGWGCECYDETRWINTS